MVCRRARPCAPWFARCVPPSISGSAFVIGETCVRRKLLRGPPALSKVQTCSLHRASGAPAFMDHPDLTITRVHATPLNLPVTMGGRSTSLSICLVDVETSAGIIGTGMTAITEEEVVASIVNDVAAHAQLSPWPDLHRRPVRADGRRHRPAVHHHEPRHRAGVAHAGRTARGGGHRLHRCAEPRPDAVPDRAGLRGDRLGRPGHDRRAGRRPGRPRRADANSRCVCTSGRRTPMACCCPAAACARSTCWHRCKRAASSRWSPVRRPGSGT